MACSCRGRARARFLWYDPINAEGVQPVIYSSEIEARAKVLRKPGTRYIPYNENLGIGVQIATAEAR